MEYVSDPHIVQITRTDFFATKVFSKEFWVISGINRGRGEATPHRQLSLCPEQQQRHLHHSFRDWPTTIRTLL